MQTSLFITHASCVAMLASVFAVCSLLCSLLFAPGCFVLPFRCSCMLHAVLCHNEGPATQFLWAISALLFAA
jgi:hypothetical protein